MTKPAQYSCIQEVDKKKLQNGEGRENCQLWHTGRCDHVKALYGKTGFSAQFA